MIHAKDLKIGSQVIYDDGVESTVATVYAIDKEAEVMGFNDDELKWDDHFEDIPKLVKKILN